MGEKGHRQYECPNRQRTFKMAQVRCRIWDTSHVTSDCRSARRGRPGAPADEDGLDKEYLSFMAELGGGGGGSDLGGGPTRMVAAPGQDGRGREFRMSRGDNNGGLPQERNPYSMRARRPCTFWAKGSCRNGDRCRFSHEGPGGSLLGEDARGAIAGDRRRRSRRCVSQPVHVGARGGRGAEAQRRARRGTGTLTAQGSLPPPGAAPSEGPCRCRACRRRACCRRACRGRACRCRACRRRACCRRACCAGHATGPAADGDAAAVCMPPLPPYGMPPMGRSALGGAPPPNHFPRGPPLAPPSGAPLPLLPPPPPGAPPPPSRRRRRRSKIKGFDGCEIPARTLFQGGRTQAFPCVLGTTSHPKSTNVARTIPSCSTSPSPARSPSRSSRIRASVHARNKLRVVQDGLEVLPKHRAHLDGGVRVLGVGVPRSTLGTA